MRKWTDVESTVFLGAVADLQLLHVETVARAEDLLRKREKGCLPLLRSEFLLASSG